MMSAAELLEAIHFLYPGWLWAWPLSLLALAWLLHGKRLAGITRIPELPGSRLYRHTRLDILHGIQGETARRQPARGLMLRWIQYALVLLCIHVALAHPYRIGEQLPTPPEYRDTVFVMDTSISMVLRDYLVAGERVDRMTILKSVLTHFIEQLEGNRIGMIVFSERPYTLVPLTSDYALLKSTVRRLKPAVLTGRTTDLGTALIYTLQQLQHMEDDGQSHKPVLVLLTDVNRTYRDLDPRAVSGYLNEQGYRLHTIGIGAPSQEGREADAWGLEYQPANFSLLRSIAESGGGRFYRADNADSLQAAIQAIQSAERRQVEVEPRHVTLALYHWPLLAGLLGMTILQLWAMGARRA